MKFAAEGRFFTREGRRSRDDLDTVQERIEVDAIGFDLASEGFEDERAALADGGFAEVGTAGRAWGDARSDEEKDGFFRERRVRAEQEVFFFEGALGEEEDIVVEDFRVALDIEVRGARGFFAEVNFAFGDRDDREREEGADFVEGDFAGEFGRGQGATEEEIGLDFAAGDIADNEEGAGVGDFEVEFPRAEGGGDFARKIGEEERGVVIGLDGLQDGGDFEALKDSAIGKEEGAGEGGVRERALEAEI